MGAGTGTDAAWFAAQGHEVVAVEPTAEFREYGRTRYVSSRIVWIDDRLPRLEDVVARRLSFDVILLSAVWMHLDAVQRRIAMPILASLLSPGGVIIMSLRHGPVPEGRVMFDVSAEEATALAAAAGLQTILSTRSASIQAANAAAGVTWSNLVFAKRSAIDEMPGENT